MFNLRQNRPEALLILGEYFEQAQESGDKLYATDTTATAGTSRKLPHFSAKRKTRYNSLDRYGRAGR